MVPEVDTKVDEESNTIKMTFCRGQMEGSVTVVVTFLWISPEIGFVMLLYFESLTGTKVLILELVS
jgi:hypothetical protein